MKKLVVLIVVAFAISSVFGAETENPKPSEAKTNNIEGKVIDVLTGEALAGVSLRIKGSESKTYTDLNGNFKIENIAPGTYDINIDYVSYKEITLKEVTTSSSETKLKVELESVSF